MTQMPAVPCAAISFTRNAMSAIATRQGHLTRSPHEFLLHKAFSFLNNFVTYSRYGWGWRRWRLYQRLLRVCCAVRLHIFMSMFIYHIFSSMAEACNRRRADCQFLCCKVCFWIKAIYCTLFGLNVNLMCIFKSSNSLNFVIVRQKLL